jgi:hypothetical protein
MTAIWLSLSGNRVKGLSATQSEKADIYAIRRISKGALCLNQGEFGKLRQRNSGG